MTTTETKEEEQYKARQRESFRIVQTYHRGVFRLHEKIKNPRPRKGGTSWDTDEVFKPGLYVVERQEVANYKKDTAPLYHIYLGAYNGGETHRSWAYYLADRGRTGAPNPAFKALRETLKPLADDEPDKYSAALLAIKDHDPRAILRRLVDEGTVALEQVIAAATG